MVAEREVVIMRRFKKVLIAVFVLGLILGAILGQSHQYVAVDYTVQKGDTLFAIHKELNGERCDVREAIWHAVKYNGWENGSVFLQPGSHIKVAKLND
jgi:hypothetical protein